ncbi:MAG: hypothetical protein FWC30_06260 [Candidatus Bathyarchaeota archaeon]|jgi:hypothetical protein|nr:hypothetical protein [Candidatus Termiticorpusculum sp.]
MFDSNSRYAQIEDATLITNNGQIVKYKKRRFLPKEEEMTFHQEITVMSGDRLDLIASRVLDDPEQFWRICDANNAMYPFDLLSNANKVLRVAVARK